MKNCKTLHKTQIASCLKETIQTPPPPPPTHPHQIKPYCVFGTKISCRDIQKYTDTCFQRASRMQNAEMVQHKCFFRQETETCLLENLQSQKGDVSQPWWPTFLLSSPPTLHHKKGSYGPAIIL